MANRDLTGMLRPVVGVAPAILTASSTSAAIDTRGFDGVYIVANLGIASVTPSTTNKFNLVVKECSSSSGTFTAVSATNLIGSLSATTIGSFGSIDTTAKPSNTFEASYVGNKRWIRVGATKSGTSALRTAITVVGGNLSYAP